MLHRWPSALELLAATFVLATGSDRETLASSHWPSSPQAWPLVYRGAL